MARATNLRHPTATDKAYPAGWMVFGRVHQPHFDSRRYNFLSALYMNQQQPLQHLNESDLCADPLLTFEKWFAAANETDIADPNAMSLATAADGEVSVRMVLMKYWDAQGFVFFTNYESRKGRQLLATPKAVEARDQEWNRLVEKGVLDMSNVQDWSKVSARAQQRNKTAHFGTVFGFCIQERRAR